MKKIAIIALLAIVLMACAPVMPSRNQTMNKTMENASMNETKKIVETNETIKMEEKKVDKRDVPQKEVVEGDLVSFPNLKAVDPDGDPIKYTFSTPLNEKGQWQTKVGDAGEQLVTITASDGSNTVSQQVLIVVKSKNKPPMIELEQPIQATEGSTLTIKPILTDPEGDEVTVSYSGWMDSNTREVGFAEAGLHKVIITASDSKGAKTSIEAIVSVGNADRAPELADVAPQMIKEGQKVTVKPNAKDADGDNVTYSFDFPLDEKGQWQTAIGDAGEYEVTITAHSGALMAEKTFMLTVESVNRPPVIELDSPVAVEEGQTVRLQPVITDAEGDEVRVSYSGWMNTDVKGTGYGDQGDHIVTISARDTAGNEARLEVTVLVEDVNRAPIFGAGSFS